MSRPETTIIIPVYNGERFLAPLLDSVLAQSTESWECICVDDGSSDSSPRILDEYGKRDSRITVIRQENGGCGTARNTAIAKVDTPCLMFADQDDILHPQAVEIATRAITSADVDCLLFGFQKFNDTPVFSRLDVEPAITRSNRNGTKLITGKRDSWPIFVWRHIFRTESVRRIPFPPISGGEDQAWMSELSWNDLSWASIDPVLYFNREDPRSRSRGVSEFYVKNVLASYDWIRERAKLYGIDENWIRKFTRHMEFMFRLSVMYRTTIRLKYK